MPKKRDDSEARDPWTRGRYSFEHRPPDPRRSNPSKYRAWYLTIGAIAGVMLLVTGLGVLAMMGLSDRAEPYFPRSFEVKNDTSEPIEIFALRARGGFTPGGYFSGGTCSVPCSIRPGEMQVITINEGSREDDSPMTVVAYSSSDYRILYAREFGLEEMDSKDWRLIVVDQR